MPLEDKNSLAHLRETLNSILGQLYPEWELIAFGAGAVCAELRSTVEEYAAQSPRVRVLDAFTSADSTTAGNEALKMATGEWIAFLAPDDRLAQHALYLVAEAAIRDPETAILYSDEDRIIESGRCEPRFKPGWDYDLLLSQNYLGRLAVFRTDLVRKAGGFRVGFSGDDEWDLALRVIEAGAKPRVCHLPFVLYHARQKPDIESAAVRGAMENAARAVNEHLARTRQTASAEPDGKSGHLRVRWALPNEPPLVSIVIPTKDRHHLLRRCMDGLLYRTFYAPIEIVIVDNGSTEREACDLLADLSKRSNIKVLRDAGEFNFSRLVNRGVTEAVGEVVVLLNNDVEVINPDWLGEMASHAVRADVGAVGAKLYYPDDRIQHGGVVLGVGGVAGHVHRFAPRDAAGYLGRLQVTHSLSCVTAACLATRREVYKAIGGFNQTDLTVALNDVDFCIRLREAGYRIIWTPHAELYHHESVSRGPDVGLAATKRAAAETAYMRHRWGQMLDHDPYLNPNLSLDSEDFELGRLSRAERPWHKFMLEEEMYH